MNSGLSADEEASLGVLRERQRYRDWYLEHRDPLPEERLLWRAQTFRHLVHLLPGQRILELGHGGGVFRRQLETVSRGRNPIRSVSFEADDGAAFLREVREGPMADCAVGLDLLDERNAGHFLKAILDALRPGGQMILFESNPWNPWLRFRRATGFASGDNRRLFSRPELYELISEVGFIRVFAVFNDFVYGPGARGARRALKNLSVVAENLPLIRRFAGGIIIHAKKPGAIEQREPSLATHESLKGAISVVVPCYNEESNLKSLVDALRAYYDPYLCEIVLVDDNSRDGTRRVIENLAAADARIKPVIRTPPGGVGRALRDGYAAATGRLVLSIDCDFQHLLPEFQDLFDAAAAGPDMVVGSRFSRHSVLLNYPWPKILANRAFHLLAALLFRIRFRDLTNNLKIIRRDVLKQLDLRSPGFSINAETGLLPVLRGCTVAEVPISWINRTPGMGVSSFKLAKVGNGYFAVLWRLLWKRR